MLTNKDVARKLKTTAALIELTGGNEYRARALSNAARTVERLDEAVADLAAEGRLEELRGIGSGLSVQIQDLLDKGTFDLYDDLVSALPPGLTEMLRVKGLGAKKVRTIWRTLGITTIEELEEVATIGRLADLDGFGEKTQENVLANIQLLKKYSSRRRFDQALAEATRALEWIRNLDEVVRADVSGPLRRQFETVDRADFVVGTESVEAVCERLHERWNTARTEAGDAARLDGQIANGMPARIDIVRPDRFTLHWWRETGSTDHVAYVEKTFDLPSLPSEEAAIYKAAGMPFIAAALREDVGEFEAAAA
ncbi:MAG: helix-hairpin-helix domain-containing protein, partial [Rhodothermales bacterium]